MLQYRILTLATRAIAVVSLSCAALPAAAADEAPHDDARFRQLGDCMAYLAVAGGLDGKKDVDPSLSATISSLGTELMFEASILGYSDDKAQTYVVNRLIERNTEANEKGTEEMKVSYGPMCAALAASVVAKPERP